MMRQSNYSAADYMIEASRRIGGLSSFLGINYEKVINHYSERERALSSLLGLPDNPYDLEDNTELLSYAKMVIQAYHETVNDFMGNYGFQQSLFKDNNINIETIIEQHKDKPNNNISRFFREGDEV